MTTFTAPAEEKKLIPFLKLGAFDENNYRPAELKKAQENEKKYGTLRLNPGDKVGGTITGFYETKNGEVMYLKDVVIVRPTGDESIGAVKIGLSTDLGYKVKTQKKKEVGQTIGIDYLGKQVSPKDAERELHKVNVE